MQTITMGKVAGSWFRTRKPGKYGDLILKIIDMKKILMVLLLGFVCTTMFAQENEGQAKQDGNNLQFIEHKKFIYCELLGRGKLLSSKVNVDIDFGQSVSFWVPDRRYKDENGKPVNFNSMVDAMNFMGTLGWEFVQAYVVTESNQNVYHWLLKMEIKE